MLVYFCWLLQERACEDVDYQVEDVSSEEDEEDEDDHEIQRRQQAIVEKEKVHLELLLGRGGGGFLN